MRFGALPNVVKELQEVQKIWKLKTNDKIESKISLNQGFTVEALQTQIKEEYSVVHLATHAWSTP